MGNFWQKLLDKIFGPEAVMAETGVDPSQEGLKTRTERKSSLLVMGGLGLILLCAVIAGLGGPGVVAAFSPSATPTPTLPGPVVVVEGAGIPTETIVVTPTALSNILTAFVEQATASPSPTSLPLTATPCATSDHFLTELACNDLAMTSTIAAVQPGAVVNVSGVDQNVTTVYIYPTNTFAPIIITATPTATDKVVIQTVIVERVITAVPGPTQTPWFFITQPPVVTVVWTQQVEVTREVTVVVTATFTNTPTPSETPTPTETPTP